MALATFEFAPGLVLRVMGDGPSVEHRRLESAPIEVADDRPASGEVSRICRLAERQPGVK